VGCFAAETEKGTFVLDSSLTWYLCASQNSSYICKYGKPVVKRTGGGWETVRELGGRLGVCVKYSL